MNKETTLEHNLKKKLDKLAKEVDQKEIDIVNRLEDKNKLSQIYKLQIGLEQFKLYDKSLSKLIDELFDPKL